MVRRDLSTGVASGAWLPLRSVGAPLEVTKVTSYICDRISHISDNRLDNRNVVSHAFKAIAMFFTKNILLSATMFFQPSAYGILKDVFPKDHPLVCNYGFQPSASGILR